jgi:hypothetical protein
MKISKLDRNGLSVNVKKLPVNHTNASGVEYTADAFDFMLLGLICAIDKVSYVRSDDDGAATAEQLEQVSRGDMTVR